MDNRPLASLRLPPKTLTTLRRKGYEMVNEISKIEPQDLSTELGLSLQDTQMIYMASQASRAPTLTQSAAAMVGGASKKYSTLTRPLNKILDGGIRRGSVLEVSGPPGSIKEALAESITRSFVEEGEEILFVDCQNMTSPSKLKRCLSKSSVLPPQHERLVEYMGLHTLPDVMIFFNQLPAYLKSRPKTGLLVLNSLSFPFQTSAGLTHSTRNALLERTKISLAKACASADVTVVITTQLATKLLNADGQTANFDTGSRAVLLPQLGSAYLPNGRTYRVMIVPHTPTSGVLRLLSSPLHIQGQDEQPLRDEAYDMTEGVMQ